MNLTLPEFIQSLMVQYCTDTQEHHWKYSVCTRRLPLQLFHVYFTDERLSFQLIHPALAVLYLASVLLTQMSGGCSGSVLCAALLILHQLHLFGSSPETHRPGSHPPHRDLRPPPEPLTHTV